MIDGVNWPGRLANLARALNRAAHRRDLYDAILDSACLSPETSVLLVMTPERGAPCRPVGARGPEGGRLTETDWEQGLTLVGWAVRTATPLFCGDIRVDPRARWLRDSGLSSGRAACIPIGGRGMVTGALLLIQPSPGPWPETMTQGLEAVAEMAGLALAEADLRGQAEHQVRHLMALHEVSRLLTSSLESGTVLTLIVDVAMGLFDLDLCCVLLDQGGGSLTVKAARGLPPAQAGEILCTGSPSPDLLAPYGFPQAAVLDIIGRQERLGCMLAARRGGDIDQVERGLLDTWSSLAGVALENSRLLGESERVCQDAVTLLIDLLAAQDETGMAGQVTACAAGLARHLGLSEAESREIRLAALLPELGSIPGESLGFQRLRQAHAFRRERWDGQGLHQLRGEAIPLQARIVAVAESYVRAAAGCQEGGSPGAVTPMTPYLQVKAGAGTLFDPRVVGALEPLVWSRLKERPAAPAEPPASPSPPPPQERREGPKPDLSPLTQREQEILSLVSAGLSNREIAVRLFLSEATVKTHVSRILQKLRLPDRTKAAVYMLDARARRD